MNNNLTNVIDEIYKSILREKIFNSNTLSESEKLDSLLKLENNDLTDKDYKYFINEFIQPITVVKPL